MKYRGMSVLFLINVETGFNGTGYLWRILIYIVIISGVIYLAGKLLKSKLLGKREGKHMGLIEQLFLGSKRHLSLVEVKDKIILLGVTSNQITKIKEWNKEEFGELSSHDSTPDFGKIMSRFRRDDDD